MLCSTNSKESSSSSMALYFLYCFDCRASLKPLELLPTTIYTFPLPAFSPKSIKPIPAPTRYIVFLFHPQVILIDCYLFVELTVWSFSMHPTAFVEMAVPQVNKKLLDELEAMGFPRPRATRALHFSGLSIFVLLIVNEHE